MRRYRFATKEVVVSTTSRALDDVVVTVFERYGIRACAESAALDPGASIHLHVGSEGLAPPPHARAARWSSEEVQVWQAEGDLYFSDADVAFRVQPAAGQAHGRVHPRLMADGDALPRRLQAFLFASLVVLLRRHQLYPLHAAALQRGQKGLLLVADSDSGKSTLAFSLVREGWHYLSDDTILLDATGDRLEAVPFRRAFGLDVDAQDVFPELGGGGHARQLAEAEKWAVAVDRLFPAQAAEVGVPEVIVVPQIVDAEQSRLVEIEAPAALYELVRQSALLWAEPDAAPRHLAVLQRLARQTRHYRLLSGRDLLEQPACASDLLAPLLEGSPASA